MIDLTQENFKYEEMKREERNNQYLKEIRELKEKKVELCEENRELKKTIDECKKKIRENFEKISNDDLYVCSMFKSDLIRSEKVLVMEAVKNGYALKLDKFTDEDDSILKIMDDKFRNDKDIMLEALKWEEKHLEAFDFSKKSLPELDPKLPLFAMDRDEYDDVYYYYANGVVPYCLGDELLKDEEFMFKVLQLYPREIDKIKNTPLINNKKFMLDLWKTGEFECSLYSDRFKLGKNLKNDKDMALKMIKDTIKRHPEEDFMDFIKSDFVKYKMFNNEILDDLENLKKIAIYELINELREENNKMKEEKKDMSVQKNENINDITKNIAEKIKLTKTVVTHFGDDLDNKSAIYAVEKWAKENGILDENEIINIERVPAGQVKEGFLNVDTGGHKGNREENGTIVIDGDPANGVKSASEALSNLNIYVPKQIVELADTVSNKTSALDSRSGLALVRYLTGEQAFSLAEDGLLDKSLTDEELEKYSLMKAHQEQQKIIDNAVEKIEKYTVEMPNGEKVVLAPEQILAGSMIAYEKGINYYASASEHFDHDKNQDGVTFAITSKPGVKLPEKVINYGKELAEKYRIDENTSGVFVNPNGQMIVAGGFKNPTFKIENETVKSILNKIENKFTDINLEKSQEQK